ncbi:protein rexA [Hafnia paralvei]|uniref:RexA n=1 Tax=Hafnia phage yong1 TaxID=2719181 RepID=A0A7D5FJ79_9CAUD|nr:protein rexA [Hafnia paralvei]YP_010738099.1 RexA [Hafnia phage yong1]MBW2956125.1 protein rexA [Hafnia paralvei]QLF80271.1 RexA [Hafnia phage yong1]
MKTGFYAAYQSKDKGKNKLSLGLRDFIQPLLEDSNNLKIGENYLYIHKIDDKTVLFTKTNDKSLVQKINKTKASVEDVKNSLADDESLGFPSFIFMDGDIIGFARTIYGPTPSDLTEFLIGKGMHIDAGAKIKIEPLMRGTSRGDVMKMNFIGRTTVKVEAKSMAFGDILKTLGAKDIEGELFDSIEIVIKPKFKRNIKKLTQDIVSNPNPQFSDISMRAKDEAGDILADHYLSEKGHLSASIEKVKNAEIAEEMGYSFLRMKASILSSLERQVGKINS